MDSLLAKGNEAGPLKRKRSQRNPQHRSSHANGESKPEPSQNKGKDAENENDRTLASVTASTRLPTTRAAKSTTNRHLKDLKLRAHINSLDETARMARESRQDVIDILQDGQSQGAGFLEAEGELERTWKVSQDEIVQQLGPEVANHRREWKLDGGPYISRYSRNGRHMVIAGRTGHVASFDWRTGALHSELQLKESIRDVCYLQDHSMVAVAQKRHVFVYDRDGVEVHRMSAHIDPTRLEYLPYHWLLASVGNAGYLKYTDITSGTMICEQRTKLGACHTMAQNLHNGVIYLGHQNGTVTLHTPNLSAPPVTLLTHLGPVSSIAVDASPNSLGRYMATAGADGKVKVWDCRNWKGTVREWTPFSQGGGARGGTTSTGGVSSGIQLEWSQKGILGVASGGSVTFHAPPMIRNERKGSPSVYLSHPIPQRPLTSIRFCPFTDIATIGHAHGLSSIIVPGAGEPNFDSGEADPFENTKARREKEVHGLLDKIPAELITLSDEFAGRLVAEKSELPDPDEVAVRGLNQRKAVPSFSRLSRLDRLKASGKAAEEALSDSGDSSDDNDDARGAARTNGTEQEAGSRREKKEKKKQRGRSKSLKRFLRKKRKNVIDPTSVALRQKIEVQREKREKERAISRNQAAANSSTAPTLSKALDRFRS